MVNIFLWGMGLFLATITVDTQNVSVEKNECYLYYMPMEEWSQSLTIMLNISSHTALILHFTVFHTYIQTHSARTILSFIPGIQIRLLIVLLILSTVLGLTTTRMILGFGIIWSHISEAKRGWRTWVCGWLRIENLQYLIQYGGPRVQYVRFIARSKALFIAQFTAWFTGLELIHSSVCSSIRSSVHSSL